MVCPSAVANNHSEFNLLICHAYGAEEPYHCDAHEDLNWQLALWSKADMKLFRPAIYVVTAELMPLLYVLHHLTSGTPMRVRPESNTCRFELPKLPRWLVHYIYRALAALLLPAAGVLAGYRLYALGSQLMRVMPDHDGVVHWNNIKDSSVSVTLGAYNFFRVAIFCLIYFTVFWREPRRYERPKAWFHLRRSLRPTYRTLLGE